MIFVAGSLSCGSGSDGAEPGVETGSCLDGKCFDGFVCLSDLCVGSDEAPTGGSEASSDTQDATSTGTTSSGTTTTSGVGTSDVGPSDVGPSDVGPSDGGSSGPGSDDDGATETGPGPGRACSTWAPDCPRGYKCNPWADDGGDAWNAARCVELDPSPASVGDPCIVQGNPASGEDNCDEGAMCWGPDPATGAGTCAELCSGSAAAPECGGPERCSVYFDGVVPLCLAECDPIAQNCPGDDVCYSVAGVLECAPDGSGAGGAFGESCDMSGECDPGLSCIFGSDLSVCTTLACCTPFCELSEDACPPGTACMSLFPPGEEPPGFEVVGWCVD